MPRAVEIVETSVSVQPNGPYFVSGGIPLRRKRPLVSEEGDPMTWLTGPIIGSGAVYALCRCGKSDNKPYCDGSHGSEPEFDGTETASTEDYTERAVTLSNNVGTEIKDDRGICAHAAFCSNRVTDIWELAAETGDSLARATAMAMIERCPSGALTYTFDGETVEPNLPGEISVIPDGPLWLSGGIPVQRSDGEPIEPRNRVTLCRCGGSANKPLCDGTHRDNGFKG